MSPDDDLTRWIRDLRGYLEIGGLMELAPFELGHGTRHFPGETTVRIMLSDLADLDNPAGSWGGDTVWRLERWCVLLADFRRLREMLDCAATPAPRGPPRCPGHQRT